MSRSIWKGIVLKNKNDNKVHRNITITPDNVGQTFMVHIGKELQPSKNNIGKVTITTKHIGHKFGEYAISKIPAVYKRNSKKK